MSTLLGRSLLFIPFLFCGAALLDAQKAEHTAPPPGQLERPNFSGRWRMVKSKSEFHGFKVPDAVIRVIDHKGVMINLHTVQTDGGQTNMSDVSYFTDGTLTMNSIKGRDAQSKAYWDGNTLVVRTKTIMANGERGITEERWVLSEDGKTLTTDSHIATDSHEADLKLVCEKEAAK